MKKVTSELLGHLEGELDRYKSMALNLRLKSLMYLAEQQQQQTGPTEEIPRKSLVLRSANDATFKPPLSEEELKRCFGHSRR
jgi:hypothetical protein